MSDDLPPVLDDLRDQLRNAAARDNGPGYVTQTFEAHELIGAFFKAHTL